MNDKVVRIRQNVLTLLVKKILTAPYLQEHAHIC